MFKSDNSSYGSALDSSAKRNKLKSYWVPGLFSLTITLISTPSRTLFPLCGSRPSKARKLSSSCKKNYCNCKMSSRRLHRIGPAWGTTLPLACCHLSLRFFLVSFVFKVVTDGSQNVFYNDA